MAVLAEEIAVRALLEWLRLKLPAKVAAVNVTRAAVLRATVPGPYVIPAALMAHLNISKVARESMTGIYFAVTGSRTTAQVVTTINSGFAGETVAAADEADRLTLTSPTAPTSGTPSVIALGVEDSGQSGMNTVFGWSAGGEHVIRQALVAPNHKGLCDGWPLQPDFGAGMAIIVGDRSSAPVAPDVRRDEYLVAMDVYVLVAAPQNQSHRDREAVHSALRCVRECLLTDEGRRLGRTTDVMLVREKSASISGRAFRFADQQGVSPLYDVAKLQLAARVFERPDAS